LPVAQVAWHHAGAAGRDAGRVAADRAGHEVGRRRIQVAALPVVARTLAISLEELFGEAKQATRGKRGPAPRWQQQMEAIAKLPKARQRFVSEMLDTVLAQH
jgi:hypothetical protein